MTCKKNTTSPQAPPSINPTIFKLNVSTIAGVANAKYGQISPGSVAIDKAGNIYITDSPNNIICKLGINNEFSIFGKYSLGNGGLQDGKGTIALFNSPESIVTDAIGNVYVVDSGNNLIRKITPDGVVSTFVGNKNKIAVNGLGINASFAGLNGGITIDNDGNLYVVDNFVTIRKITPNGLVSTLPGTIPSLQGFGTITINPSGDLFLAYPLSHLIYKFSKNGIVSLFAGSGKRASIDGKGITASFSTPRGITTDNNSNIFVADASSNLIRKILPDGTVTTIAGSGVSGFTDGIGTAASFSFPMGIVLDSKANLYIADNRNSCIRKLSANNFVSTIYIGQNIPATTSAKTAVFKNPAGLAIDISDNIYVADQDNNMIRKINPSGIVTIYAGKSTKGNIDGISSIASFYRPTGVNFDISGNLYVADYGNNQLRKITPSGIVSTIELFVNSNGATGPLNDPTGVAVDLSGNIFYTNTAFNSICKISGSINSTFSIGVNRYQGDGAFFVAPYGIALDKNGNVYIADTGNSRIYKITKDGTGTVLAGSRYLGNVPMSGNKDGLGTLASFNKPKGITVDTDGNVYVADTGNNLIRKITAAGLVSTIAGLNIAGNDDGDEKTAKFNEPTGIAINASANALYVSDAGSGLIRKITLK